MTTHPTAEDLAINLLDPQLFVQRREHEAFARLRQHAPVCRHAFPGGPDFYAVTRYDDVAEMLRNPTVFSSAKGTQIADKRAEGHGAASVHNSDPPQHTALRAVALPGLRKKIADELESEVRDVVRSLLDATPDRQDFDFVELVAVPLPMMVLARLLGVPAADQRLTVVWANTMSDVGATPAEQNKAREDLFNYFRGLVASRREAPRDDLATLLATSQIDGRALSDGELDAYFMLLVVAGNETTRFLISIGLEQLCAQPDEFESLRGRRPQIALAVEEMVRFVSPVIHMRRTVTEAYALGGVAFEPGDKVVAYFSSANRDEARFADPHSLVTTRSPNPHLAFGFGAHFCMGAHVARMEARVFFEEFFERIARCEQRGQAVRAPSHWFNGLVHLPLAWSKK
jgi:cytochrome P450